MRLLWLIYRAMPVQLEIPAASELAFARIAFQSCRMTENAAYTRPANPDLRCQCLATLSGVRVAAPLGQALVASLRQDYRTDGTI